MYHNSEKHLNNMAKAREVANSVKCSCQFCSHITNKANIKRHESFCYLNPTNKKLCPVCNTPIKHYIDNTTCGYSCANKFTKTGPNNGNWKDTQYTTTCFHYHKRECVICQEQNIVAVHHLDENRNNNDPSNLIPLCPTHHQYWHSRHKHLVEQKVIEYITKWKESALSG